MDKISLQRRSVSQTLALMLTALLILPFFTACGGSNRNAQLSPVDDTRGGTQVVNRTPPGRQPQQVNRGLSTGQKVAILAGAAALYYLYNQHKNKQEQGSEGKYYLSKNGRVYYRDAQGRAHWVTPPREGIRVPEEEAQRYRDFQGYNGRSTGRDLTDLVPAQ